MRSAKDVEAYLTRLSREFTHVEGEAGTYVLPSSGGTQIAVRVDPPLVVLRVHMGDVKKEGDLPLFKRLLQLNAKELMHTSYGLDDDRVVLSAALELENLDFNELEAALDEMDIALAQQLPELATLAQNK